MAQTSKVVTHVVAKKWDRNPSGWIVIVGKAFVTNELVTICVIAANEPL